MFTSQTPYAPEMLPEWNETNIQTRLDLTHQALLRRLQDEKDLSPATVLCIGAAVIFHGALEERSAMGTASIIDESVLKDLADEHGRLADDLEFLETLWETKPESDDIESLCLALREHLRTHLERDHRLFYQSIPKLQAVQRTSNSSWSTD